MKMQQPHDDMYRIKWKGKDGGRRQDMMQEEIKDKGDEGMQLHGTFPDPLSSSV
jgi:hypothetical protein